MDFNKSIVGRPKATLKFDIPDEYEINNDFVLTTPEISLNLLDNYTLSPD